MASARLPSSHIFNPSSRRHKLASHHKVARCQSLGDEGKPVDMVDANLMVLRQRIEDLREKERRLPTCRSRLDNGWSYLSSDGDFDRRYEQKMTENIYSLTSDCLEVMGIVSGAVGLVLFSGSLGICLFSLLVHHLGN